MTDDLVRFVRDRLDEDEQAAAAASAGPWTPWRRKALLRGLGQLEHAVTLPGEGVGSRASIVTASWLDAEHIARHDPARVLAEVTPSGVCSRTSSVRVTTGTKRTTGTRVPPPVTMRGSPFALTRVAPAGLATAAVMSRWNEEFGCSPCPTPAIRTSAPSGRPIRRSPLVRTHRDPYARQNAGMGVSYMVRARTREECQRELDRICQLLDAVATILPTDRHGSGWIARAVPTTKAPADGEGLAVER